MAVYTIKNSNSVNSFADAFDSDSAAADTLTVEQSGFLYTAGAGKYGARLAATGAWKVTINGVITSKQFVGLALMEENTASSSITIGTEGEVCGAPNSAGVLLASAATLTNSGAITGGTGILIFNTGAHTITNKGQITAIGGSMLAIRDVNGVSDDSITNSGTIVGELLLGDGKNKVANTGVMGDVTVGSGDDSVTNSKQMQAVVLGDGVNTLTNSGVLEGDVTGGAGADKITNSKDLVGNIDLGGGVNTFTNSGSVTGALMASAGSTNTIVNSKLFNGSMLLNNGADKVTNSGTIGALLLGDGANTLSNTGSITLVTGGAGVDTITNNGTIVGIVDLGAGDDKYTGGAKVDFVGDGSGSDTILLGGGDDSYLATGAVTDGVDKIDGGAGVDTYNGTDASTGFSINIDTVDHNSAVINVINAAYSVAKNTAIGSNVGTDNVVGFENVYTGSNLSGDDVVHGNSLANIIITGGGNDAVFGYAGNDIVDAGAGSDILWGGLGRDTLDGGAQDGDNDFFVYMSIKESTVAKTGRDIIVNFEDGFDKIVFSSFDADPKTAGPDALSYQGIDVKFTGVAGQLRVLTTATGYAIEADTTGDGKADFAIDIADTSHSITWGTGDFIL